MASADAPRRPGVQRPRIGLTCRGSGKANCPETPQIGRLNGHDCKLPLVHLQSQMDPRMQTQTRVANHVSGFCREHGISRAHFYNLLKRGDGPVIMKVGRRTLISAEAAAEWRRRMEASADVQRTRGGKLP